MLIKVNGDLLAVNFRHGVESSVKSNGHKNRNAGRRYTICTVKLQRFITGWKDSRNKKHDTTISFFDEVASGKSTCSLGDTFNKNVGRAVSFSRAIEKSNNDFIKNNSAIILSEFCKLEHISEITDVLSSGNESMEARMEVSSSNQNQLANNHSDVNTINLTTSNQGKDEIHPVRIPLKKILPIENLKVDVIIHQ